jgi:hypothetical protein
MALIIRIARFIARMGEALDEALQAREAARRQFPHVPDE